MPSFFLVELFSGTGSFGRGAKTMASSLGYRVKKLSIDIHHKYNPSSRVDVLTWDYRGELSNFLPARLGKKDVVWVHASPPCNEYSVAKTSHPRDLPAADALVKRTLRIIDFVQPHFFTIENPVGLLRTRPFMRRLDAHRLTTSYCKFGRPFRKNTDIWTNVNVELPRCEKGSYNTKCSRRSRPGCAPPSQGFVKMSPWAVR